MSHTLDDPRLAMSDGLTVETIDGHRLGIIAEVGEDFFLTHRSHGEDFWLPEVFVRSVGATNVVLQLDSRALRRYIPGGRPQALRSAAALGLAAAVALTSVVAVFA